MSTDGSTWVPTSLWALALGVLAWRARWGAKAGGGGGGGGGGGEGGGGGGNGESGYLVNKIRAG